MKFNEHSLFLYFFSQDFYTLFFVWFFTWSFLIVSILLFIVEWTSKIASWMITSLVFMDWTDPIGLQQIWNPKWYCSIQEKPNTQLTNINWSWENSMQGHIVNVNEEIVESVQNNHVVIWVKLIFEKKSPMSSSLLLESV